MVALSHIQIDLVQEILDMLKTDPPAFPAEPEFKVLHAGERAAIAELVSKRALLLLHGFYVPTLLGLQAVGSDDARATIRRCNALVEWLKEKVIADPRKHRWTAAELAEGSTFSPSDMKVFLTILVLSDDQTVSAGYSFERDSPFVAEVSLALDGVLDAQPFPEVEPPKVVAGNGLGVISRLYVHNFRTFVSFEWKPPTACVLVGENGAGKSALLEVLWLLQDLLVDGLPIDRTTAFGACTAWLGQTEQTVEIDIDRGAESFRYRLVVRWEGEHASLSEELRGTAGRLYRTEAGRVEIFGDDPAPDPRTTIFYDRRRSFIASLEPRPDNRQITAFRDLIGSIWAMKPDGYRIVGTATDESSHLKRDLSNFASWYRARVSEDTDAYASLRDDLRRAVKGFDALRLEPISPKTKALRVRFSFGETSYELDWADLSDGQRVLIALYGMFRFGLSRASLIAIDEVENFVSPTEIQPWLLAVADAASDRGQQLLLVSHHPESINYLAGSAMWRMWRDGGAGHTRIDQLEPDLDSGETAYDALKLELWGSAGTPES